MLMRSREQGLTQLPRARSTIVAGMASQLRMLDVQPATLIRGNGILHSQNLLPTIIAYVSTIAFMRFKTMITRQMRRSEH